MKILFIITGLGVGGAELQLRALTQQFLKKGFEIQIISLVNLNQVQFDPAIKVHFLNLNTNPLSFIKAFFRARNIITSFQPKLIHAHMFHANIFSRILKLFYKKIPLINSAHSVNEGGKFRMLLYRATRNLPEHCTQVSKHALEYFVNSGAFSQKKSSVHYNGIDEKNFKINEQARTEIRSTLLGPNNENIFLYIAVGRLVEVKNHTTLIKAFSLLPNENKSNSHLLILGQGPLKEMLQTMVSELKLNGKVSFVDHSSNVDHYLSAADAFVLPSLYEGFPLSVIESLFCLCPVISSNNGGMVEVFSKNYPYLFSPKDKERLALLMKDMQINARQLKLESRANLDNLHKLFSIENIAQEWIDLYENLQ
jgi:glycosyltransferase involved in cell wall biosynthesis